jgi:hypothetical protein
MSPTQIGIIIGVLFGFIWAVAGASALNGVWRLVVILASIFVSAFLVTAALRAPATPGRFNGAIYGAAVTFEVIAIVVAVLILNRSGQQSLVPPIVAAIVGLHFLGLWLATGNRAFVGLAASLCGVGIVGSLVPPTARLPIAGIGSALALWTSTAWTIFLR